MDMQRRRKILELKKRQNADNFCLEFPVNKSAEISTVHQQNGIFNNVQNNETYGRKEFLRKRNSHCIKSGERSNNSSSSEDYEDSVGFRMIERHDQDKMTPSKKIDIFRHFRDAFPSKTRRMRSNSLNETRQRLNSKNGAHRQVRGRNEFRETQQDFLSQSQFVRVHENIKGNGSKSCVLDSNGGMEQRQNFLALQYLRNLPRASSLPDIHYGSSNTGFIDIDKKTRNKFVRRRKHSGDEINSWKSDDTEICHPSTSDCIVDIVDDSSFTAAYADNDVDQITVKNSIRNASLYLSPCSNSATSCYNNDAIYGRNNDHIEHSTPAIRNETDENNSTWMKTQILLCSDDDVGYVRSDVLKERNRQRVYSESGKDLLHLSPMISQEDASDGSFAISPSFSQKMIRNKMKNRPIARRKHSFTIQKTSNVAGMQVSAPEECSQKNKSSQLSINWLIFISGTFFGGVLSSISLIGQIRPTYDIWNSHPLHTQHLVEKPLLAFGTNSELMVCAEPEAHIMSQVFLPFLAYVLTHRVSYSLCLVYYLITMGWLYDAWNHSTEPLHPIVPPLLEIFCGFTGTSWALAFVSVWNWGPIIFVENDKLSIQSYLCIIVYLGGCSYFNILDLRQKNEFDDKVGHQLQAIFNLFFIIYLKWFHIEDEAKCHVLAGLVLFLGYLTGPYPSANEKYIVLAIFIFCSVSCGPYCKKFLEDRYSLLRKVILLFAVIIFIFSNG